jgi:hypothetical protein
VTEQKSKNEERAFDVIVIALALIMGIVVRYHFISGSEYPINDGGLFYKMTGDLIRNNFTLPAFSTYNQDQIPFAYPPLAFYLAGYSSSILNLDLLDVLRHLPCLISIVTILAFYLFAKEIVSSRFMAATSLYLFAMIPRSFEWFVMGGGITRSLGFFFCVLASRSIWRLYTRNDNRRDILSAIIFSGFTILSHPETGLFVAFTALMFFLFHRPTRRKFINSLIVAAGVLVLISPWFLNVYSNHGIQPFLGAGGTGQGLWFEFIVPLTQNYRFENVAFLSLISVLSIIGVFLNRGKETLLYAGMIMLGYTLFPRSGVNLLTMYLAILSAIGLRELILFIDRNNEIHHEREYPGTTRSRVLFSFVLIYTFMGAFTYKYSLGKNEIRMTTENFEVISWIESNVGRDELVMLIPPSGPDRFWPNDYFSEWMPALTDRKSVTTVQGSEWIPGKFKEKIEQYQNLRSCNKAGPICVEDWEAETKDQISFVLIDQIDNYPDLVNSFTVSSDYQLVYRSESLIIFKQEE